MIYFCSFRVALFLYSHLSSVDIVIRIGMNRKQQLTPTFSRARTYSFLLLLAVTGCHHMYSTLVHFQHLLTTYCYQLSEQVFYVCLPYAHMFVVSCPPMATKSQLNMYCLRVSSRWQYVSYSTTFIHPLKQKTKNIYIG